MIIVGIDPGLANTAVTALEDGRFILAKTIKTPADGKPQFPEVMARGMSIARQVEQAIKPLPIMDVTVAIEGYEDFGGGHLQSRKGKPIPNRWTTPAVCALIGMRLEMAGYKVVWQRPSVVMRQYAPYKQQWEAKRSIVPGDELLTNDHLRSAGCHALAWSDRRRTA